MADRKSAGVSRAEIVAEARSWIGTPYRHQASLRGAGADCLGLIRGVYRVFCGPEKEPIAPYSPNWAEETGQETLRDAARRHLVEIDAAPCRQRNEGRGARNSQRCLQRDRSPSCGPRSLLGVALLIHRVRKSPQRRPGLFGLRSRKERRSRWIRCPGVRAVAAGGCGLRRRRSSPWPAIAAGCGLNEPAARD